MADNDDTAGPDENTDQEETMRLWRESYGNMVPEKIVDTKIGEDGRRYYKVQWAASTMEPAKNFLEAEHLVRKYWDPVEKKLKIPSRKSKRATGDEESGPSSKRSCSHSDSDQKHDNSEDLLQNSSSSSHTSSKSDDDDESAQDDDQEEQSVSSNRDDEVDSTKNNTKHETISTSPEQLLKNSVQDNVDEEKSAEQSESKDVEDVEDVGELVQVI